MSKQAELDQNGGGGLLLLAALGLWLFSQRQDGAVGNGTPGPTPAGAGQIKDLQVQATNPLVKHPGDAAAVTGLTFQYKGPAQGLTLGWGIKPSSGILGVNFDQGAHLMRFAWNVTGVLIDVQESADFLPYTFTFALPQAKITIPEPGVAQTTLDGGSAKVNEGLADVWVWIFSPVAAQAAEPQFQTFAAANPWATRLTFEPMLLVVASPADVFDIQKVPMSTVSALSVSFA